MFLQLGRERADLLPQSGHLCLSLCSCGFTVLHSTVCWFGIDCSKKSLWVSCIRADSTIHKGCKSIGQHPLSSLIRLPLLQA